MMTSTVEINVLIDDGLEESLEVSWLQSKPSKSLLPRVPALMWSWVWLLLVRKGYRS